MGRIFLSICILGSFLVFAPLMEARERQQSKNTVSKADRGKPNELRHLESQKRGENLSVSEKAQSVALRPKVQKEAALSAGIKAGVKYRYEQIIDNVVDINKKELDALFNFTPLLITRGDALATPPIIMRAGAALRLSDDG
ncbi:MAG: type IV secretory system conjugative DNA transfer family protein, partial [Candidatus Adiutrix sp.]